MGQGVFASWLPARSESESVFADTFADDGQYRKRARIIISSIRKRRASWSLSVCRSISRHIELSESSSRRRARFLSKIPARDGAAAPRKAISTSAIDYHCCRFIWRITSSFMSYAICASSTIHRDFGTSWRSWCPNMMHGGKSSRSIH